MSSNSNIEWTDSTWNPIIAIKRDTGKRGWHCEKVSPACDHCYAASMNKRSDGLVGIGTGLNYAPDSLPKVDISIHEPTLLAPLRWRKARKIFVCSMTDLFGDWVTDEMIDQVFAAMALCPQHTFQVLTKRPERMRLWVTNDGNEGDESMRYRIDETAARHFEACHANMDPPERWPLPNVWLGVTAENQEWADKRIPLLIHTPAAKRFVSVEPMLGPVNIDISGIDWVICGGESGHGARPMHPDWARSLRDQCQAAGVPFFFKQWGAWQNGSDEDWEGKIVLNDGRRCGVPEELDQDTRNNWPHFRPTKMAFVGKDAAGRLLDGREWNEFPEVQR